MQLPNEPPLEETTFSLSISDLMAALLLIFILLLASALLRMQQTYEAEQAKSKQITEMNKTMTNIAQTYHSIKDDLYEDLKKEFNKDLDKWKAKIDKDKLSFQFLSPDVLFEQGQSTVRQRFKVILDNFFPRYIKVLRRDKYIEHIQEIRIEGHTSSEWQEGASRDESYFENMELSQDRTRSVLQYVFGLINKEELKVWSIDKITANGLSFSKRQFKSNGEEDEEKSRRVEFRIRTDADLQIQKILKVKEVE